jgi:hypothetical protein
MGVSQMHNAIKTALARRIKVREFVVFSGLTESDFVVDTIRAASMIEAQNQAADMVAGTNNRVFEVREAS